MNKKNLSIVLAAISLIVAVSGLVYFHYPHAAKSEAPKAPKLPDAEVPKEPEQVELMATELSPKLIKASESEPSVEDGRLSIFSFLPEGEKPVEVEPAVEQLVTAEDLPLEQPQEQPVQTVTIERQSAPTQVIVYRQRLRKR
jgi:hypothetical protein